MYITRNPANSLRLLKKPHRVIPSSKPTYLHNGTFASMISIHFKMGHVIPLPVALVLSAVPERMKLHASHQSVHLSILAERNILLHR